MNHDIFIFIPAYNVQNTLINVLSRISKSVWNRSNILVIDDGSKDNTKNVYLNFLKNKSNELINYINLNYYKFEKNLGYGSVVKFGIKKGLDYKAKYIACVHGDNQYPPEKLDEFISELESFHGKKIALVQGSRHLISGDARIGGMPLYKRVGGKVLTLLENVFFKQKLTDRHSGFIVYSSDFLKKINLNKLSNSFDIDLELISIADANGFILRELPIKTCYANEKSNLNVITYGIRVLKQIFKHSFFHKKNKSATINQ